MFFGGTALLVFRRKKKYRMPLTCIRQKRSTEEFVEKKKKREKKIRTQMPMVNQETLKDLNRMPRAQGHTSSDSQRQSHRPHMKGRERR